LPGLSNSNTRRQLERKFGFRSIGGTRHDTYELHIGESLVASVDVERHKRDIGIGLVSLMAKQLCIRPRQFAAMVQCGLSRDDFLQLKAPAPRGVMTSGGQARQLGAGAIAERQP